MVEEGGYFCNISEKRGKFIYIYLLYLYLLKFCVVEDILSIDEVY